MNNEPKYIKLLNDFAFKRIFSQQADKKILIHFLNSIFENELEIIDIKHLPTEHLGESQKDRIAIFDLYCELSSGERILIELQNSHQAYFIDREIYYATWPLREQAKKGAWNYKLNRVIILGICDFIIDRSDPRMISHKVLMDKDSKVQWTDKLLFVNMEMQKFKKERNECHTLFDKWVYRLKNLNLIEENPEEEKDEVFRSLLEICKTKSFSKEELMEYKQSVVNAENMKNFTDYSFAQGKEEGFAKGKEEGYAQGQKEILDKLRSSGLSEAEIQKILKD